MSILHCETVWPENMKCPPPKRKLKNGKLIIIENETENSESQITDCTIFEKRRIEPPPLSNGDVVAQPDSLDQVVSLPGCTGEERRTSATEIFSMFCNVHPTSLTVTNITEYDQKRTNASSTATGSTRTT